MLAGAGHGATNRRRSGRGARSGRVAISRPSRTSVVRWGPGPGRPVSTSRSGGSRSTASRSRVTWSSSARERRRRARPRARAPRFGLRRLRRRRLRGLLRIVARGLALDLVDLLTRLPNTLTEGPTELRQCLRTAPDEEEDQDDDEDDRDVHCADGTAAQRGRAARGITSRRDVWVGEKLATLLSMSPAAFPAAITSTSDRRVPSLPRHDPDPAGRPDQLRERREAGQVGRRVGGQEDDVRVGLRLTEGHVVGPFTELLEEVRILDAEDRDTCARPDPELVETRSGVRTLHAAIVPDVAPNGPLLVFGPRSTTYDFGPQHPLTPRRFGPGIDLLRAVGAEPSIEPEPATDEQLRAVHEAAYIDAVRRFSEDPGAADDPAVGIGSLDNPAFAGMHEAAAAVAGGSLRAMDAILRGETRHAYHPGGGLHHAMPARASGFCIYDDPALAIARARAEGLRVLYVDLDVHHGDGVQEIFYSDPGVLTVSFHESGRYLFPQTGFADELGVGPAAGTAVNVPFEPYSGEASWLPAVQSLVPA